MTTNNRPPWREVVRAEETQGALHLGRVARWVELACGHRVRFTGDRALNPPRRVRCHHCPVLDADVIDDLLHALRTMITAVDESTPESFPGHHRAFLEMIAIPRAQAALAKAETIQ